MPKFVLYLFFMLLLLPASVSADNVSVNITGNKEGSGNSVKYKSDTSANYQSSGSVKSETYIRIDNNGEVKEYRGSDGDINLQSSDGKTTVKVNNNSATNSPSPNSSARVTSKTNVTVNSNTAGNSPSSASPSAADAKASDNSSQKKEKAGLWAGIKKQLAAFFKLFS